MAWDDDKTSGDEITADEWDNHTTDQKSHSARHESGGTDEINVTGLAGDLADPQEPESHAVRHEQNGADALNVENLASNGASGQVPTAQGDGSLLMEAAASALGELTDVHIVLEERITVSANSSKISPFGSTNNYAGSVFLPIVYADTTDGLNGRVVYGNNANLSGDADYKIIPGGTGAQLAVEVYNGTSVSLDFKCVVIEYEAGL
jgi:hypothetical protein